VVVEITEHLEPLAQAVLVVVETEAPQDPEQEVLELLTQVVAVAAGHQQLDQTLEAVVLVDQVLSSSKSHLRTMPHSHLV
jgi:hypothetical protein